MPKPKLPNDKRRDVRLVLRLTPTEAAILIKASDKMGLDVAKFVRMAIGKQIRASTQLGKLNKLPNDFPDVV